MGDAQVLSNLTAYALAHGLHFSYTHKLFYVCLLRYALVYGERTDKGLRVCISAADMGERFSISLRMVTQSLKVFCESGILLRESNEDKGFMRKPSYTYLVKDFS